MKRLFKYIILLPLLLVVSCVYDEGLSIEDVLKVSDNIFEFTAAGDEIEFTIESYCGWEIKCEADWVSFSEYEGNSKIVRNVLSVSENLSLNARTAQAEIVNDRYGINIKLNISQEAGVPYIKTSSERLKFEEEGGVAEIKVESNISWEASFDADWIEIGPKSGLSGVTTMTINVNKNASVESRSSVIKIVNSEYGIEEEISVVQSEFVPELKVIRENIENVSWKGSTEEIEIESNVSWESSVDVDWIEISPKSGESGVCTMTIVVGENVLEESREGIITLKNEEYSLTVKVKIQQNKLGPNINGYEYVDLGLPSGLKWATCNVGASSPEEYGDYYAWGEIETKSEYDESNSKTYGKSMSDISGNAMYDVARAKWGGSWRLPTKKELEELESKCKWEWTTINGENGFKVTGPNGNSIFLPAAGLRNGSSHNFAGERGDYWSSTPYESGDLGAYRLVYVTSYYIHHEVDWFSRKTGLSVRPVSE